MNIEKTLLKAVYIAFYPVLLFTTGYQVASGIYYNNTNQLKGGIVAVVAVVILFVVDGFGPLKYLKKSKNVEDK